MCTIIHLCVQVDPDGFTRSYNPTKNGTAKGDTEDTEEESIDRSSAIQRLLKIGLREYKMEKALNMYRDGKITLWKAAESAGVSLRGMMEAIKARDIPYQYDLEALEEYVDELLTKRKTVEA